MVQPKPATGFRPNASLQAIQVKVDRVRLAKPSGFRPNPALAAIQAKMANVAKPPSVFRPNAAHPVQPVQMKPALAPNNPRVAGALAPPRFLPNEALQVAQARMNKIRGKSGCGCASCTCSARKAAKRAAAPALQRHAIQRKVQSGVIQRSSSESEFSDDNMSVASEDVSEDDGCEEDLCIDSDCDVKDSFHTNGQRRPLGMTIRMRFYPGFTVATENWRNQRILALRGTCPVNNFRCQHCNQCTPNAQASLDHVVPVATHWNTVGYDTDQQTRATWYNNTANLEVVRRSHNSAMGSGGVNYRRDVGPNFVSGPNC
jgi:hypothetical protein